MKTRGVHIIGELTGCDLSEFAPTEAALTDVQSIIGGKIAGSKLTELGHYYHYFGPNAVTAVICLAESHISFHTWPEEKRVSVDLFVCNFSQDNSRGAETLFDFFSRVLFRAEHINKTVLQR